MVSAISATLSSLWRPCYRNIGFDFTREPFEHLTSEYMEQYDRRRVECTLQPGARQVLTTFSARGYIHSVLSATEQSRLEEMVLLTGLHGQFTNLVGISDCYARSKTDHGRQLISSLRCDPSETVMVGDTLHDYEVASALGIGCILIPSGHCSRERMASCGAQVAGDLGEFVSVCLRG